MFPILIKIKELVLDILFPPVCLVCRRRLDINKSKFFRSQPVERVSNKLPLRARGKPELTERSEGIPEGLPEASEDNLSNPKTLADEEKFTFVCVSCSQKIQINNTSFCPVCFARLPENKKICHFDSQFILAAAGSYENEYLGQLIILLKYQGIKTAAIPLAEIVSRYIENSKFKIENFLIVPLPLHWRREKKRGFNQSDLIAEQLSKNSGLTVAKNILKRIRNTPFQVELKEKEKREINVQDCFAVEKPELLFRKNVILLDDVFTSGATIREAVKAVKKAGAGKIIGLVVAKA